MSTSQLPLDELLEQALSFSDPRKREEWLVETCGQDTERLQELRSLIIASEKTLWIDKPLKSVSEELQKQDGSADDLLSLQLGPFKLVERIGKGGMGEVYLARQNKPVSRLVAIKTIQKDLESTQILQRFQSEQQTLANMEHPNIARIIDAGIASSGIHYIAMEFVNGQQLLDYVRTKGLDVRGKIRLMLQCCRAIQHAHQKGTIHRDIKPSNVLVTLVDGEPLVKVIDFGIAKAMVAGPMPDEQASFEPLIKNPGATITTTGVSPGTPRFMSPEQYSSNPSEVDTRSDIYSLGAVLYNLLVDVPPFDHLSIEDLSLDQLREAISKSDPVAPSVRSPEQARFLKGDLDAVVIKAMQQNPEDRYQSVGELYDELDRYLNDLPVKANPESAWAHLRRLGKRHKILIGSGVLAITGLLFGMIVSIVEQRRTAGSERHAKRQAFGSDLLLASMAISKGNYSLTKEILGRHSPENSHSPGGQNPEARNNRLDWRLLHSHLPQEPATLGHFPTKLYFGLNIPDRGEIASGSKDSRLRVLNRKSGQLRLDIDTQQKEINGLARSPDGKTIATAGDDGTVKFWDLVSGEQLNSFTASTEALYQIGWTPDGKQFVTAGNRPDVSIWSLPDFVFQQHLDSSGEDLECLDIGSQGQVAYGSGSGGVRIGRISDTGQTEIQSVSIFTARAFNVNRCSTVVFSPSGKILAVGLDNGYLILLRERDSKYHVVERVRFSSTVTAIAFQSDELKLAIGEANGSVHALNLPKDWPTRSRLRFTKYFLDENSRAFPQLNPSDPESLWKLVSQSIPSDPGVEIPLDSDRVYLEFSEQLKNVFFSDNYTREWTDEEGNARQSWREIPKSVVFKGNGVELQFENRYSGWSDSSQLTSQGRLESWAPHSKRVSAIVLDETNSAIVSFSEDGFIRVVNTGLSNSMKLGGDDVSHFVPISDSRLALLKTDHSSMVLTLDSKHNEPIATELFPTGSSISHGLIHLGNERWLVPVSERADLVNANPNSLYLWDLKTKTFSKVTSFTGSLDFRLLSGALAGNRVLVVANGMLPDAEKTGRVEYLVGWDLGQQSIAWKTEPTRDGFRSIRSSPHGRFISYLKDRKIHLIDANTGKDVLLGDFAGLHISSTCFSPDDRFVVAAISDNSIVCFRTADGQRAWSLRTAGSPINDLTWSKDAETLVCVSQDGMLRTLDTILVQVTAEVPLQINDPSGVKLSPEEDWIYILGREGTLLRIPIR